MFHVVQTMTYQRWERQLSDGRGRAAIAARVSRLAFGLMGDVKHVGGGVRELRVHHGPGYRIYFVGRGDEIIILLCGGDKGSQRRDIEKAKAMAKGLDEIDE
jgi:putative addiction module killer protein